LGTFVSQDTENLARVGLIFLRGFEEARSRGRLGGGRNQVGVRLRLRSVTERLGFGVDDRHYLGGREGRHRGEGGSRFSPTGLGVLYERFPPKRISVVHATSFDDALVLADRFKRQQLVILNLQRAGDQLSTQIVDFCAGLAYASDGQIQVIADRLFLLTPRDMEVSDEKRKRLAERTLFNQF
jgi:hypothetical protein